METNFLRKEWIAVALANAKRVIFREDFVSISELQQFSEFLQCSFNNSNLDIVITHDLPNSEGFIIQNDIVIVPKNWNIYMLPDEVKSVLLNENLFIKFFIDFENEKIERLNAAKQKKLKLI